MEKSFGLFFHLKKENKSDGQKLKVYMRIPSMEDIVKLVPKENVTRLTGMYLPEGCMVKVILSRNLTPTWIPYSKRYLRQSEGLSKWIKNLLLKVLKMNFSEEILSKSICC